jgi:predicted O-methyltransferase YrrM
MASTLNSLVRPFVRLLTDLRERSGLASVSRIRGDAASSGTLSAESVENVFRSPEITAKWTATQAALSDLGISDQSQGVNAGDRRALYYLICALAPASVLEVGTHVGASTMHIAAGMRDAAIRSAGRPLQLTTVDIQDVNDSATRPWERFGSKQSPRDLAKRLGFQDLVEFVSQPSLEFMKTVDRRYDFIFLDGDHRAQTVYREIPEALRLLDTGGFVLLHDFFPGGSRLWPQTDPLLGPWLAVERLRAEGLNVRVIPLGTLPWPTKLGTHVTSLAILTRE